MKPLESRIMRRRDSEDFESVTAESAFERFRTVKRKTVFDACGSGSAQELAGLALRKRIRCQCQQESCRSWQRRTLAVYAEPRVIRVRADVR